jgi:hypothetical protein
LKDSPLHNIAVIRLSALLYSGELKLPIIIYIGKSNFTAANIAASQILDFQSSIQFQSKPLNLKAALYKRESNRAAILNSGKSKLSAILYSGNLNSSAV